MLSQQSNKLGLLGGVVYSVILSAAIYFEYMWLAILPVGIALAWCAIKRMDLFMAALLMAVPVSLNLQEFSYDLMGLYMPTEPMLAVLLVLFVLRSIKEHPVDKSIINHSVSVVIGLMMLWMGIVTITSWDIVVSIKFMVSRAWFIAGFFYFLGHLMLHNKNYRERMILFMLFPLTLVIVYTIIKHAGHGFSKHAGHWMMKPFFKDHTSYGAVLAMFFPPAIAMLFKKDRPELLKAILIFTTTILGLGIVLSFTRAAWVSLAGVVAIYVAMRLGFKLKTLLTFSAIVLAGIWMNKDSIIMEMQRNKQDSSDNLTEHVESISNVSSDDSNLERLNRWNCALSLFKEKPITGWGPGTYQFVYAPFQEASYRTRISTNNGDGGNAHSEYLGPLAEQGVLGAAFILLLLWYATVLGFRLWENMTDNYEKNFAVSIYLGLMTYFIHGVLNNYLDTDKASAPFWGFLALLVVFDLELRSKNQLTS